MFPNLSTLGFLVDKGVNIDMWTIKITIKANQIGMDVLLISQLDSIHTKTMFVPKVQLFSIFTFTDKHGAKNF